jgi:Glyoxalase-like domain
MDIRIQCLCIDCHDPGKVAAFWADALGWRRTFDEPDQVCLEPPAGSPEDGIVPRHAVLARSGGQVDSLKNRLIQHQTWLGSRYGSSARCYLWIPGSR